MASFRLQPLIEFAEERSKSAARELQKMREQWTQAEEKLQQLKVYLNEYRTRLVVKAADGMAMNVMLDFQRFIAKLELAISAQSEEVVRCQQRWEKAQQLWQEREREVKAYYVLRTRHQHEEQRAENRRDQRQQDESALNIARRRTAEEILPQK